MFCVGENRSSGECVYTIHIIKTKMLSVFAILFSLEPDADALKGLVKCNMPKAWKQILKIFG